MVIITHHLPLKRCAVTLARPSKTKKIVVSSLSFIITYFFVCCSLHRHFSPPPPPPPTLTWYILVPLCVSSPLWIFDLYLYFFFVLQICPTLSIHTLLFVFSLSPPFSYFFFFFCILCIIFLSWWSSVFFFYYFFFLLIFSFHLRLLFLPPRYMCEVGHCVRVYRCVFFSVACGKKNNTLDLLYPRCFSIEKNKERSQLTIFLPSNQRVIECVI